jgi:hypothetical protein
MKSPTSSVRTERMPASDMLSNKRRRNRGR